MTKIDKFIELSNTNHLSAINYFEEHLSIDEKLPLDIYLKIIELYDDSKFIEKKIKISKKALIHYPNSSKLYIILARLELSLENYKESLIYWKEYFKRKKETVAFDKNTALEFLKTTYMANDIDLYKKLAIKMAIKYNEDEDVFCYMYHSECLDYILKNDLENAKLKFDLLEIKYNDQLFFSKDYLKKQIKLKEILIMEDIPVIKLVNLINFDSRNKIMSQDILGLSEYVEIQNNIYKSNQINKLKDILNNIEEDIKCTNQRLNDYKSLTYDKNIKELALLIQNYRFNLDLLPSEGWMILSMICASRMYVKSYFRLRNISRISAIYSNQFNEDRIFEDRANAELGIRSRNNNNDFYNNANVLLNLYYGDRKNCIDYFNNKMNKDDKKFAKYLEGKSIAIVGPVDVGLENGDEIDSFDIVIRFNYKGLDGYDKLKFGTRTNYSPYIEGDLKNQNNHKDFFKGMVELDYISYQLNNPRDYEIFRKLKTPMRKAFRAWGDSNNPFFRSQPNAIQKLLLDILRFPTGRIKIFNANLWIADIVNTAYRTKSSISAHLFIWHDIISNFNFTKILWEKGIFEVDEVLAKVLSMSEEEYAMTIAERYGNDYLLEEDIEESKK